MLYNLILCQKIIQKLKQVLQSEEFLSKFRVENAFTRKRKLTMYQVVLFLFYTSKRNMQANLSKICVQLTKLQFPEVSKQAISKARKGILPELFQQLLSISIAIFYQEKKQRYSWHGYYPFAIDGSKVQVPRKSGTYFGYAYNNKARYPTAMAAASILYDIGQDIIVDARIDPFLYGERSSALEHLKYLEEKKLEKQAIILWDRGYHSLDLIQHIEKQGYYFLERVQKNILAFENVKSDDEIVYYFPEHQKKTGKKEGILVRVIHVTLEDGTIECLVTNVLSPEITKEEFQELYFQRWKIEGKYEELKSRWEIEEFSGASEIAVKQEFWIHILLSNITSMIKADADKAIQESRNLNNKYQYQANRSNIIGYIKDSFAIMLCGEKKIKNQLDWIYEESKKGRSQIQPNRKCKRPRVQLKRKHFNNRKRCI